jgi:hypothetical protein
MCNGASDNLELCQIHRVAAIAVGHRWSRCLSCGPAHRALLLFKQVPQM